MATKKEQVKINIQKLDQLGEIRQKIKELKTQEDDLSKEIKPLMEDGEIIETERFRVELVVSNTRVLDQEAIRKKIGQKKFFDLAKVGMEDLRKVLGADEIDEVTTSFKPVRKLDIDPIE